MAGAYCGMSVWKTKIRSPGAASGPREGKSMRFEMPPTHLAVGAL
jgi:hypothetical protein